VRRVARHLLQHPVEKLSEVRDAWRAEIRMFPARRDS
jgi:hypothetical protein